MTELTAERLRELLDYDRETGVFRWKVRRSPGTKAGDIAGTVLKMGYRKISINDRRYAAHRLAWLYVHGHWPIDQIDHKNTDRGDNRFDNLREATPSINSQNKRRAMPNSKTGVLGVSPSRGKFIVGIRIDGKKRNLGRYATVEAAYDVYLEAKRRFHPGCTL